MTKSCDMGEGLVVIRPQIQIACFSDSVKRAVERIQLHPHLPGKEDDGEKKMQQRAAH